MLVRAADSLLSRAVVRPLILSLSRARCFAPTGFVKGSDTATTRRIKVVRSALMLVSASGRRRRGALRPDLHLHLRCHLGHLCQHRCIYHGTRHTRPQVTTCHRLRRRYASSTPCHTAAASSPLSTAPAAPAAPLRCCCCSRRLCFIRRRRPPSAARPASFPVQCTHTPVFIIVIIAPCSVCLSPTCCPRVWRARWSCW